MTLLRHRASLMLVIFLLPLACLHAQHKAKGRAGEVVAHSLRFNPDAPTDDMPPALRQLLRAYKSRPRYAQRQRGAAVAPLLSSVRDQGEPYNRYCPYYIDDEGIASDTRCLTGCVATCIEQVLSYYRYPQALQDTLHGWSTPHYSVDDVMPGTSIDWDNILPDYHTDYSDAQAEAIAQLSLFCGMAAHMQWGVGSSGASIRRAVEPLRRAFGYATVEYVQRSFYSTPAWNRLLRHELSQGRPLCYTGHNIDLSGHAFNIDGVDSEGFYHINWGYDGQYDGYFDLDYLNPFEAWTDPSALGQQQGFFSNQTALLLHPTPVEPLLSDSLSEEVALEGVEVESVTFHRQPDLQGYVLADVTLRNLTQDSLAFTLEALTNLPTDTALFLQADYVALSTAYLLPNERRAISLYCQFAETGERTFSISADDSTFLYSAPISVAEGVRCTLSYGAPTISIGKDSDGVSVLVEADIANLSAQGVAGDMVFFFLQREGETEELRHYDLLELPAGEQQRVAVRFNGLEEGARYTLRMRCRYRDRHTLSFQASDPTDGIRNVETNATKPDAWYDLQGRRIPSSPKGLFIRNNKKYILL